MESRCPATYSIPSAIFRGCLTFRPTASKSTSSPDTFGLNANVPEIRKTAASITIIHCRAHDQYFRFTIGSLALRRSVYSFSATRDGYNGTVEYDSFVTDPLFCHEHGVDVHLFVYGVGDHGGGPTRRDVEGTIDIPSWPLYPTIKFGTCGSISPSLKSSATSCPP